MCPPIIVKTSAISKSTAANWKRLDTTGNGRLTQRANKTLSQRKTLVTTYVQSAAAEEVLRRVEGLPHPVEGIMSYLCMCKLRRYGLWRSTRVKRIFRQQPQPAPLRRRIPPAVWDEEEDILGYVYQSLLTEGERNQTGRYYTTHPVTRTMLENVKLKRGERLLDPCCGSGAFLMQAECADPSLLYGVDTDPVAVMLATTNLLCKYAHRRFVPHIYCHDFLADAKGCGWEPDIRFQYIFTNPPWGTDKEWKYSVQGIHSHERASLFFAQALAWLKPGGTLHFLLPNALLHAQMHSDFRQLVMEHTTMRSIHLYDGRFDGVFTGFFSLCVEGSTTAEQAYEVHTSAGTHLRRLTPTDRRIHRIPVTPADATEDSIVNKMKQKRNDALTHSQWALGIVTGNNKQWLMNSRTLLAEPILTGKQIQPFVAAGQTPFIEFSPSRFQQCARERFYRAPEKLVYRFIARHPIVAYDNQQRLCLNSANILIPDIEGIPVRWVGALLNSSLYHFYYIVHFPDIKVLKRNLQQLPFPKLDDRQQPCLGMAVGKVYEEGASRESVGLLDKVVFDIFGITDAERSYVYRRIGATEE